MNKDKVKNLIIGISILLLAGVVCCGYTLAAENPKLYIFPSSLTKNVGETFEFSVKVDPGDQKVCVVEGELILNNLSCHDIELENGIMSQTSPSCSNPYFLLGIPTCTTSEKTLFTVTVKGEKAGSASASFARVDIIGEGVSLSSDFSQADYSIEATAPVCECDAWTSWESQGCGQGNCSGNEQLQTRTRTCLPSGCKTETETRCAEDSACVSGEETAGSEEEDQKDSAGEEESSAPEELTVLEPEAGQSSERGFLASLADIFGRNSLAFKIIALIILIAVSVYILLKKDGSFFSRKRS